MEQAIPERHLPWVLTGRGRIGVIGSCSRAPTVPAAFARLTTRGRKDRRPPRKNALCCRAIRWQSPSKSQVEAQEAGVASLIGPDTVHCAMSYSC